MPGMSRRLDKTSISERGEGCLQAQDQGCLRHIRALMKILSKRPLALVGVPGARLAPGELGLEVRTPGSQSQTLATSC